MLAPNSLLLSAVFAGVFAGSLSLASALFASPNQELRTKSSGRRTQNEDRQSVSVAKIRPVAVPCVCDYAGLVSKAATSKEVDHNSLLTDRERPFVQRRYDMLA